MLSVRVDGAWLSDIGAWADLTYSHTYPHGSDQATFRMKPGFRHPALRGGALVEIFDGGVRIWIGRMVEPGLSGEFAANGLWSEGKDVLALDESGDATRIPDTAIDAAIGKGAVSWTRPASLSTDPWGDDDTAEPLGLHALLDGWAAGQGKRIVVDADGAVRAVTDPTTPKWYVPHAVAGHGLTLAEDAYFSHLIGRYLAAGPMAATVTVGDDDAAARWGYKERVVDLTPMGVIDDPTAEAELAARLALVGARMGFAEGLELGYGQVTTTSGIPVPLTMPQAGDMVRLCGVTDQTRALTTAPNIDIVVAKSSCADGARALQLSPVGKADRNLEEALTVAVAAS